MKRLAQKLSFLLDKRCLHTRKHTHTYTRKHMTFSSFGIYMPVDMLPVTCYNLLSKCHALFRIDQ